MEQSLLLFVVGAVAGVMAGMFGIGGGAIIVPALVIFLGFTQTAANGTSLAALVLPVGVFACLEYYRQGKLHLAPAFSVAGGLAIGSWFGAGIALDLPREALSLSYAFFLIYMGWRYLAPIQWYKSWHGVPMPAVRETTETPMTSQRTLLISFAIGLFAGVFAGMFGIGGGVVIVAALMGILAFDQKLATGTSLGALLLPVGLPAAFRYYQAGDLNIQSVLPLVIGLVLFQIIGAKLTLGLPTQVIRRAYGGFLWVIALRFLMPILELLGWATAG